MMSILDDLKGIDLKSIDLNNPQTRTLLLTVLISLIAAALYIYFVFIPQFVRVFALSGDIGKMRLELKSAQALVANMDKLKNDLKENSEKVELSEKKLPAEQEIPTLLEDLSSMAKDSKIRILSIVPVMSYLTGDRSGNKSQIYREIPILITAKSGYHQLGRFLNSLENAGRFMKVVDIGIKADKASPKEHDVELIVCTYILLSQK